VLERIGLTAAAVVYVKRVSRAGVAHPTEMFWAEEDEVNESRMRGLDLEVLRYHARYKPSLTADVVFSRTETH
jgi:hypothetical protein